MGIEWIIYSHHDSYPLTEKFIQKINYWVNNPEVKKFGVIGFNVLHNKDEIKCFDHESTPLRSTARCPLEKGGMIYKAKTSKPLKNWLREDLLRGFKNSTRINYNNEIKRPFAVESVFYTTAMVNINQYQRYIVPDSSFTMFLAWDDIAFQFLKNNVYNIVLPNFHYAHDQSLKLKYDLPLKSPIGNPIKREYLYGKWNHHDMWEKKWGFRWNQKYVRSDFKKIKKQYKGTLLMDFYRHDPKNGPLRYFEL